MQNQQRKFDQQIYAALGEYIYVLRDPRDNKVFYVGKGTYDRVFDHFKDAELALQNNSGWTAKLRRIVEIWEEDLDVDWFIVRHSLQSTSASPVDVFDVEAAVIDVLDISQNGPALNDVAGHQVLTRGILSPQEVSALALADVNPKNSYQTVFVFPIQNASARGIAAYDATRCWWGGSPQKYSGKPPALAVGIDRGTCVAVFDVQTWAQDTSTKKWEFLGNDVTNGHEFANKNWATIISAAMGYWQRGNYLVVQFDGKGKFKVLRGSSNKASQNL